MQARRLTLSARALAPHPSMILLGPALGAITPRSIPKQSLARVPLRDLELEAQYAEVREALARYREPEGPAVPDGATKCHDCGTLSPEDIPRCSCGAFLHLHLLFTCPSCSRVVARDARDCNGCGSSFWSAINPPSHTVTDAMVREYMDTFSKSGLS